MLYSRSVAAAALLVLTSCGGEPAGAPLTNIVEPALLDETNVAASHTSASSGATAEANMSETQGGDGSPLELTPLQADDAADLDGELACSFATTGGERPILLGRANVRDDARAGAVVRNGDYVERLVAREDGGFGAMARGQSFGGKGLTVTIERGARQETGNESTAHAATLLAQRADGAERRFEGLWTCGP